MRVTGISKDSILEWVSMFAWWAASWGEVDVEEQVVVEI